MLAKGKKKKNSIMLHMYASKNIKTRGVKLAEGFHSKDEPTWKTLKGVTNHYFLLD